MHGQLAPLRLGPWEGDAWWSRDARLFVAGKRSRRGGAGLQYPLQGSPTTSPRRPCFLKAHPLLQAGSQACDTQPVGALAISSGPGITHLIPFVPSNTPRGISHRETTRPGNPAGSTAREGAQVHAHCPVLESQRRSTVHFCCLWAAWPRNNHCEPSVKANRSAASSAYSRPLCKRCTVPLCCSEKQTRTP